MSFLDAAGLQKFFTGLKSVFALKSHSHSAMTAASASTAGNAGFVPAPAAGAQSKYLRGDGTWQTPTNTTYSVMKAASASTAGAAGLVPAPAAGKQTSFLRGDGTWVVPTNTTYKEATVSASGLMSAADKAKLTQTNIAYGTCATAAATAEKAVTISGNTNWALSAGSIVCVKFTYTNTASNPTLNVNSTGAKSIVYSTAVITTGSLGYAGTANRVINYMYDGTNYVFIGWSIDNNTTYSNASLGSGYGTCTTAEATAAKVVTLSSYALVVGGIVSVKFTYAVPASATMNINSKGAKAIFYKGASITAGIIKAGDIATFVYDGTQYQLISFDRDTNTTYSTATTSASGLLSAADKTKLDGIATGATKNVASSTVPKAAGTAAVGTETNYARGDHVHPVQTTITGNAGTATKWATARNINGMSVQGDANRINYGSCSTAAATVEKVVACTGFSLITGAEITVKFTVTNTAAAPTLNVNGTGAKAIYYRGSAISAGYLAANRTYTFRYNGTQYDLVGDLDADCIKTYTHTRSSDGVHNLVGSGANGKVKFTANIQSGDTFQVNGTAKSAYVMGESADTALAGEALTGKWVTFVYDGTQINFKGGGGLGNTKLAAATAAAGNVLSGKTFYSGDKTLKTGTMTNQGAKTAALNCGASYTIPAGYHNGSGKVTANSLSSQTSGTATATDLLNGKTAWVGGSKLTGTMPNLSSNATITHTSDNGTKVIVGDAVFMATNSDNTKRFEIRYNGTSGYITGNTLFATPASNLGDAAASQVLSGKTFTSSNGVKQTGTLPDRGYEPTGSGITHYNPGDKLYVYMYMPGNTSNSNDTAVVTRGLKYPAANFGTAGQGQVLQGYSFTGKDGVALGGSIGSKAGSSVTISPGQSYTFDTAWKYCTGNMTVTASSATPKAAFAGRLKLTGYTAGSGTSAWNAYVRAETAGYYFWFKFSYCDINQMTYGFGWFNAGTNIVTLEHWNEQGPNDSALVIRVWLE